MHHRFRRRPMGARASFVEVLEGRRLFASAVSIGDATLFEGNSGTTTFNFTVIRGGDTGPAGQVSYTTQAGTASAGSDFVAKSGAVLFAIGENQKTISITVNGDTTIEPNETFKVILTGSGNTSVVDGEGIGTIKDDDAPLAPDVTVSVQGGSEITDGQAAALDFGSVSQGSAGVSKLIVVKNTGNEDLTTSGLTVPAGFTLTGTLNATLTPGESDSFTVTLNSTAIGTKAGTISFATNDPNENPFNFPVTGIVGPAGQPEVTVSIQDGATISDGQSTPVDFGSGVQGTSTSKLIVVKNEGTANLNLSGLTVPTGFVLTGTLNATLTPGESDSFTITFPATSLGTVDGVVSFVTNDANENPFNFPVTGSVNPAGAAEIAVSLSNGQAVLDGQSRALDFGVVTQGAVAPIQTFLVQNLGSGPLTLSTPTVPAGFTLIDPLVNSLGVGESDTFSVSLASSVVGANRGSISIANNDANESPFDFPVAGSVNLPQSPEISVTYDDDTADAIAPIPLLDGEIEELDFGSTIVGEAGALRTFTVTNAGTTPLTAALSPMPTGYELVEPLSDTIAPAASDTFTVRLSAAAVLGRQAGTINIISNDSDENPFGIVIGGTVASATQSGTPIAGFEIGGAAATSGQSLDFGARPASSAIKVFDVVVKNTGDRALELGEVVLPAGFSLSETQPTSVEVGVSATVKIAFSASTAGTYGGTAIIPTNDPEAIAFELTLAGIATSGGATGGDVAVTSVTASKLPTAVVSGANADVAALTVKVRNNGTTDFNGPIVLAINASADDKLDAGDGSALFTLTKKVRIRPGQTVTLKANTPLKNAPEGDVTLLATATAGNSVSTLAGPGVTVAEPFVNLTSSLSPVPKKPLKFGKKSAISVGLENTGNTATTDAPAEFTLIVSTDRTAESSVYQTTASAKLSIKAGAKKVTKLPVTIPAGEFAPGNYFLLVKVNAALNESNGDVVAVIPFAIE